jgi:hypothetical protein
MGCVGGSDGDESVSKKELKSGKVKYEFVGLRWMKEREREKEKERKA